MPGYNSPRRGTARTVPIYFCVVLCIVYFGFCVLFVCKCVLYYCHRVSTQLAVNKYINKIVIVTSSWSFILFIYIDDARSNTNQSEDIVTFRLYDIVYHL
jgi:hypothetical protein